MRERPAVLFANETFYRCFSDGDHEAMASLWAALHPVSCLHPGWEPLFGRQAVLKSWQPILKEHVEVECLDPEVQLYERAATVVCYEKIGQNILLATNMFVPEAGEWRMVHHQAGPTRGRPVSSFMKEKPTIN